MYAYTESIKMKITHGVTEESYVFGQTELVILKHFSETRISHEMASKYMIKPLVGSIDVECELRTCFSDDPTTTHTFHLDSIGVSKALVMSTGSHDGFTIKTDCDSALVLVARCLMED